MFTLPVEITVKIFELILKEAKNGTGVLALDDINKSPLLSKSISPYANA